MLVGRWIDEFGISREVRVGGINIGVINLRSMRIILWVRGVEKRIKDWVLGIWIIRG